jgi:ribosomal protein S18 acetylase RimI-like enzyme
MTIEIRRLSAADATILDRVAVEVFDEAIAPARVAAYLAQTGHLMIVAIEAGVVVGQTAAVIHRHPDKLDELYIDEVGVTPRLWRQGIARRMLDDMFEWGRSLGCRQAWVGTEPDNQPARSLYESRGAVAIPIAMYDYDL